MRIGGGVRRGASCRAGIAASLLGVSVCLAGIGATWFEAQAQTAAKRDFNIPAGSLSAAIAAFGKQSGLQVSYPSELTAGKTSAGISGSMSNADALSAILAGSDLTYSFANATTVSISGPQGGAGATVEGAIALDTIDVSGGAGGFDPNAIYTTPAAVYTVNREMLDRVPATSTGDIFKGVPGVQIGDKRNGVDFQPNIRGAQGHGRVKVIVDGSETATQKRAFYGGTQERNYVDPDFLSGFSVMKGPDGEYGSIGGTINMRTLSADDLITDPSKNWGLRIKSSFADNSSDGLESFDYCKQTLGARGAACLAGDTYTNASGTVYDDRGVFNTGAKIPSDALSGSMIGAWRPYDPVDVVFGYSHRVAGNYSAGTNGDNPIVRTGSSFLGRYYYDKRPLQYLSLFQPGDEVYGTYFDTETILAKVKLRLPDDHSLSLNYNHFSSDFSKAGFSYPTNGGADPRFLKMIFQPTSYALQDRYSLEYQWNPDDPLWKVKADAYLTETKEVLWNYEGLDTETTNVQTMGLNASNTSAFKWSDWGVKLKSGFSLRRDSIDFTKDDGDYDNYFTVDIYDAGRVQYGAFVDLDVSLTDWLTINNGIRYDGFWADRKDRPGYTSTSSTFTESDGEGASPHTGATISPWESTQFFTRYSKGWRAPSNYELFQRNCNGTTNGSTCVEGLIRPETVESFEYGANFNFSGVLKKEDRLGVKVTRFDNQYENYITGGGNSINPFANRPSARFRGIELASSYDMGLVFGEYTLTYFDDAEICRRQGDYYLLGIPASATDLCYQHVGSTASGYMQGELNHTLTLGMRLFDQKLTVGGRANFVSGSGIREESVYKEIAAFDSYQIYDLFADYKQENFEVAVSVENLLDTYYFDAGTSPMLILPAPGRTMRFTTTAKF